MLYFWIPDMSEFKQCDLKYWCHKKWTDLALTATPDVRFCTHCTKSVFALQTRAQLRVATAVGRCVSLMDDNEIVGWIGEPEGSRDWMEEESTSVRMRADGPLSADRQKHIQSLFPLVFGPGVVLQPQTWIHLGVFTALVAADLMAELKAHFPELTVDSSENES